VFFCVLWIGDISFGLVIMAKPSVMSKKRKFVADGVFYSEINEVILVVFCE
jgi:hypothetical protein